MSEGDETNMQWNFIPLNKAERFDRVDVRTVERWKESELSGDEWRYSYVATLYQHGYAAAEVRIWCNDCRERFGLLPEEEA